MSSSSLLATLSYQTKCINEAFLEHIESFNKIINAKRRDWEQICAFLVNLKDYETFIFCIKKENLNALADCLQNLKNAIDNDNDEKKEKGLDLIGMSKKEVKSNFHNFQNFLFCCNLFQIMVFFYF
jgi:hypothetical protein